MLFNLLGPLELIGENGPVPVSGIHQRRALAFLLLHANSTVSTVRLAGALWDDDPPVTARKILQNALSALRKIFTRYAPDADGQGLLTTGRGYSLVLPADLIDLHRYRGLVDRAGAQLDAQRWDRAAQTLREAESLWRGEALADLAEPGLPWPELAALRESRWSALEDRLTAELMMGLDRQVVAELTVAGESRPERERLCALRMVALYRNGRPADALDAYRQTRQALAQQWRPIPGDRLRALEREVLTQSHQLSELGFVIHLVR